MFERLSTYDRKVLTVLMAMIFILICGGIFYCANLPLSADRTTLEFGQEIHLKSQYNFGIDFSEQSMAFSLSKYSHVFAFFVFAFIASLILPFRKRAAIVLGAGLVFSIAIELEQGFIAGRSGQLQDVLPNLVGMFIGLAIAEFGRSYIESRPRYPRFHRYHR